MAQHMRPLTPGRSPVDAFGAELRRLRIEHGLSQAGLGKLVHHSDATIGKIEKAERLPPVEFCDRVDTALVTGGKLAAMCPDRDAGGKLRRWAEERRRAERAERVRDALVSAGLTLDVSDQAQVERLAAQGSQAARTVTGWITRAVEHARQAGRSAPRDPAGTSAPCAEPRRIVIRTCQTEIIL